LPPLAAHALLVVLITSASYYHGNWNNEAPKVQVSAEVLAVSGYYMLHETVGLSSRSRENLWDWLKFQPAEYYSNVLKAGSGPQAVAFCSFSNGSSLSSYDANADTRKRHISRISTIKRTMVLFCEVANSALSRKRSCATQGYKPPPSLVGPTMYPHCNGVPTHIHGMQSRLELCRRNWSHRSEPQLDTGRPLRSLIDYTWLRSDNQRPVFGIRTGNWCMIWLYIVYSTYQIM